MKTGVLIVLTLLAGSVATHFLLEGNGYVLISFRGYTVEMSVPILLFLGMVFYLAVRICVRIWRAPRALGEMAGRARSERSSKNINKGFIALSEGKMARGERLLTKGAATSEAPLLSYLAAARAAQMQGDQSRRDGWLKMAYSQEDGARNAVLLTQAELQLLDGEHEQARASLNRIRDSVPNHPQALRLLAELHTADGDWDVIVELLPALRKAKSLPVVELDQWAVQANAELLSAADITPARIEELWQGLSRLLRKSPRLLRARARALVATGQTDLAEIEIKKALNSDWDDELIMIYSDMQPSNNDTHLQQAEAWLAARPEDPLLLYAAGRACIRSQLWGKARSYLESSLAIRATPLAYEQLGQLMLRLDEQEAATRAFANGLTLSNKGIPDLPLLEDQQR